MQKNIFRSLVLSLVLFSANSAYSAEPSTKLYVFDCGEVNIGFQVLLSGWVEGVLASVQLKNTCYLIQQGDQELLWETGLTDSLFRETLYPWTGLHWPLKYRVKKTLESQLKEIGLVPDDIEYVAVSHMHDDHAGNLELFKNAKILIQEEEGVAAFSLNPDDYYFDAALYDDLNRENFVYIKKDNFDVFGDGRVKIIKAPGHTPGHQVLFVDLENQKNPILLSGDLFHTKLNYERSLVPLFNHDKEETLKSMEKIQNLIDKTGAELWIQHDPEQYKKLKLSPDNHYD